MKASSCVTALADASGDAGSNVELDVIPVGQQKRAAPARVLLLPLRVDERRLGEAWNMMTVIGRIRERSIRHIVEQLARWM